MADRYADRYQGRPTRAEDGRAPGQASPQAGESDPLAELARLIGQTDPFANLGRGGREPPPAPSRDDRYEASGHDTPDEDTSGHDTSYQDTSYQDTSYQDTSYQDTSDHDQSDHDARPEFDVKPSRPSWMQRVAQREAPQSYEEPVQATKTYNPPSFTEPSFDDSYPTAPQSTVPQDPRYQDQRYEDPRFAPSQHDAAYLQPHDPAYGQQQPDPSRYDDALYGAADHGQDQNYDPHAVYPEDAYAQQGYDEEAAERARPKRGGMTTVVMVAALAVVGTAAAYAWSHWHPPRNGEAPIIKADPGPNKVVPPTQSADGSSKPIQDRVATAPGSERIVSREEQPVDPNTVKTGPRVVFPPLTQNPNPNPGGVAAPVIPASRQAPAGAAAASSLVGDEPRKVRTLAIRPDQADAGPAAAPVARQPAAAPVRAPAPATTATTTPANAPMSLSPGAAPTRTASNNPAAAAPASTGGYVVQISSQRSEADAQASYRALQGKFPSVLGSRAPLIKRADLGEKGIYYRAMVGPFGTPDEASQFCGSLKTAGGQCVVQRN